MNEQRDETASDREADDDTLLIDGEQELAAESPGNAPTSVDPPSSGDAAEDLHGLVTFIVSNLLDDTSAVEVEAEQRGSAVHMRLHVPSEELGKVIGRQGRVARAMRTALTVAGSRHNVRASLDIEG